MHHTIIWLLIAFAIMASDGNTQWSLNGPETVVYDSARSRFLVSNMNTGDIVSIDRFGSYELFVSTPNMNRTYGMVIVGDTVYVGCDGGAWFGIVGFDLGTGDRVFFLRPSGYTGVNGMAADSSGNIYFAETGANRVVRIRLSDQAVTYINGIPIPNAVLFDARHNRLLVTTDNYGVLLYLVDLSDLSVSTTAAPYGQFSGLTEDAMHNVYMAYFSNGTIFRYDSTLSTPAPVILSGQNGPEGICFARQTSTLAVPNLMANYVRFYPFDVDIWANADTALGPAPLVATFEAGSPFELVDVSWDFGDGNTDSGLAPVHTYDTAGLYTVSIEGLNSVGDTLRRRYDNMIGVITDSLWADSVTADSSFSKVEVTISGRNTLPLREIIIPVEYSGPLNLIYSSFSTVDCRTEQFGLQEISDQSTGQKMITFRLKPRSVGPPRLLEPGSGALIRLTFYAVGLPGQQSPIGLDGYLNISPTFVGDRLTYEPQALTGSVTLFSCCRGLTGNVDGDPGDITDIGDVTELIAYLFITYEVPSCLDEANADGIGAVDIGDLTRLIDYLFTNYEPLEPCG